MTQKLFIGGLAFSTSTERLREFCSQVEGVESASVITDRATGQSRGFGFVEMASVDAAKTAVQQLNGRELDGRQLRVELAKPQSTGSGRGPGGGGGGRGGNRW
jgi:RNA recognition motif-containing protein